MRCGEVGVVGALMGESPVLVGMNGTQCGLVPLCGDGGVVITRGRPVGEVLQDLTQQGVTQVITE